MIIGKQNLLQWFEMQQKPYFSILRKGKEDTGNYVASNKESGEGETMERAKATLDRALSLISTGDFFIYCSDKPGNSSKGRSETYFSISMADSGTPSTATPAVSGHNPGYDYETMMQKATEIATEKFQQIQTKAELEQLKKRAEELEKENRTLQNKLRDPFNKVVGEIAPHIGGILESIGWIKKPSGAISGLQHDNNLDENSPEYEQRMNSIVHAFCDTLAQRYPVVKDPQPGYKDWLQVLELLTNVAKNDPGKIDFALKYL